MFLLPAIVVKKSYWEKMSFVSGSPISAPEAEPQKDIGIGCNVKECEQLCEPKNADQTSCHTSGTRNNSRCIRNWFLLRDAKYSGAPSCPHTNSAVLLIWNRNLDGLMEDAGGQCLQPDIIT